MDAELNWRPEATDRPEHESPERKLRGLAEPGRHLTDAPVESFRWSDVELDHDPPEWTKGVDRLSDLPTGENLTEPDLEEQRRGDRFRQTMFESYDELNDAVSKVSRAIEKSLGPRPDGHAYVEAVPDRGPVISSRHHADLDAGGVASAVLAVGIVAAELTRRGVDRLRGSNRE